MKTLQVFLLFVIISLSFSAAAQTKTETFAVSGECGMCKKKIETAAKAAGATYAVWNVDSKKITVKYNHASSSAAKIQQGIAGAGYDTHAAKASDSAYNSLHECCKYERTAKAAACCADATCCAGKDCCADGTCTKDASCCKDKACCTSGTSVHEAAHSGKAKTDCCAKQ